MTSEKTASVIAKIRALRTKAEDGGATEAEAMECAAMAARLMSANDLTEADIHDEIEAGTGGAARENVAQATKKPDPAVQYAANGIAALTETKIYYNVLRGRRGAIVETVPVVVGLEADREFALYLIELVRGAAIREWKGAMVTHGYSSRDANARNSFKIGVGVRLSERMKELSADRRAARTSAGTGLIVLKDQLIAQAIADVKMKTPTQRRKTVDGAAYNAGRAAGDRIGIGRPMGAGQGSMGRLI
jgi:hypothetical protein